MEDCIYREAAIDAIWEVRITPGGELFNAIKRAQEELIKQLPSAGPERKKGKWEWNINDGFYYCSECDAVSPREDQHGDYCDCPNFCPNCGAEMERE